MYNIFPAPPENYNKDQYPPRNELVIYTQNSKVSFNKWPCRMMAYGILSKTPPIKMFTQASHIKSFTHSTT